MLDLLPLPHRYIEAIAVRFQTVTVAIRKRRLYIFESLYMSAAVYRTGGLSGQYRCLVDKE